MHFSCLLGGRELPDSTIKSSESKAARQHIIVIQATPEGNCAVGLQGRPQIFIDEYNWLDITFLYFLNVAGWEYEVRRIFNQIQDYLYSTFHETIVAKQLYRKWSVYNRFIYCRNVIYLTYGKIWFILYILRGVGIISSQVFGHLGSFKGWIQTEACVILMECSVLEMLSDKSSAPTLLGCRPSARKKPRTLPEKIQIINKEQFLVFTPWQPPFI